MFSSEASINNMEYTEDFAQGKKENIAKLSKKHEQSNSSSENIVKAQEQVELYEEQLESSEQGPFFKIAKMSQGRIKNYDKQKLVKQRVYEKIRNSANIRLYPELMGPHPIYTKSEWDKDTLQDFQVTNLKQYLFLILKQFWKEFLKKKKLKQVKTMDDIKYQPEKMESIQKIRGKYKKYTIEFKKSIVKKIESQLISQGPNGKSLRYYIVRESKLLNIHPKNISRWIGCDLDRKQGGRSAKYPILQYKLEQFMNENPQCPRKIVVEEAKRLKDELGYKQQFNFSKGWFQRFRARMKQNKVARTIQRLISEQLSQIQPENNSGKQMGRNLKIQEEVSVFQQEYQKSDD